MTLEVNIFLIGILFALFTLFIYCYDSEERKKRTKLRARSHPIRSFEFCTNPTRVPNPNPNNIGFNVANEDGPSTVFTPVGAAPGVHHSQPTPYPPSGQPPYPIVQSSVFPSPVTTSFRPSAPAQDNSQPPSYYEATRHN